MIFYFSGTGNSLYVAKKIVAHNDEELISISDVVNSGEECQEYYLRDDELIGFVYPVYAWGPPQIVLEFIKKLKFVNYRENYTFTVVTCGASIGNTIKVLDKFLKEKGIYLDSGFSMKMPNNYIIMGDVDSKALQNEKLFAVEEALRDINNIIEQRQKGVFKIVKGLLPGFLINFINTMFNKYAIDTAKFHVNDNCTGCGTCKKVCNCNNIKVIDRPKWGNNCTQCLACIHYCPQKAIQYGKTTEKKGRYTNPNISIDEVMRVTP